MTAREERAPAEPPEAPPLTELLRAWGRGDAHAGERVAELLYGELHQRAAAYMGRERRDHTLQPTALVHETFLRLAEQRRVDWQDRNHFFGIAAVTMRRILIEHARSYAAAKRGGSWCRVPLEDGSASTGARSVDLLDLDAALGELAAEDPQAVRLVELRYFAGLSIEEAGDVLQVSSATVKRDWALARAWLFRRLRTQAGP